MYECESWTIKKTECQRIDAFKLWCWRKLLRVPWTARRSNQSILKDISPRCSLEGLMLKLKLQYFGPIMRRANSLEKTLMLRKTEGRRKRRQQKGWDSWTSSPSQSTWVWASSGSWSWTGKPGVLQSMGLQRVGHNLASEQYQWLSKIPSETHTVSSRNGGTWFRMGKRVGKCYKVVWGYDIWTKKEKGGRYNKRYRFGTIRKFTEASETGSSWGRRKNEGG